jgi:hypothetical protein
MDGVCWRMRGRCARGRGPRPGEEEGEGCLAVHFGCVSPSVSSFDRINRSRHAGQNDLTCVLFEKFSSLLVSNRNAFRGNSGERVNGGGLLRLSSGPECKVLEQDG